MAFWLFNCAPRESSATPVVERVDQLLDAEVWDIAHDEPHRDSLAPGDLVLIYLGAPQRVFVAHAEVASSVHSWGPDERGPSSPDPGRSGVRLVQVERWDPPVPMDDVLSRIGPGSQAKADFDKGVVGITRHEFEAALAEASTR